MSTDRVFHRRRGRRPAGRRRAVTLIEAATLTALAPLVLCVTGVSVQRARHDCQTQLCAKQLGVLAQAGAVYIEAENGWFLGSPVTTGQQLWPGGSSTFPPAATDTPGDVVQIWDWAAPIARMILPDPLHPNRAVRWREQLITGTYECPSNYYWSVPFPMPTSDFVVQRMVSYDSIRGIMTRGGTAPAASPPSVYATYFHPQVGGTTQTPFTYAPRIDFVGEPGSKAFLADGARFTSEQGAVTTHDTNWQASTGGAFSDGGPTQTDSFQRSYFRSSRRPDLAPRAYRHACGQFLGLNVAYFDGHVEWMSEALSRNPDPWWPTDTVLPFAEMNPDTLGLVQGRLIDTRPDWWPTGQGVPLHYRVR